MSVPAGAVDDGTEHSHGSPGPRTGLRISALAQQGSLPIRIDWLGDIVQSNRSGRATRMVQTSCTKIGGDIYGAGEPVQIKIPVALLRLLRPSDIWQHGYRIGSQGLVRHTFGNLLIDDKTAKLVVAGQQTVGPDGLERFELDYFSFDAHRHHTSSFLVRVQVSDDAVVLVPCMELVRFYFGASGSLLSAVFSGAFAERQLHAIAPTLRNGVANLSLAPGIHPMAAPTVARIAFDPAAKRAFGLLKNSGVAAAANRKPWYPKMGFPLQGRTDLTAEGQWIGHGRYRVFIVSRLNRCTHPFPFERLYYDATDDAMSGRTSAGVSMRDGSQQQRASSVRIKEAPRDRNLQPRTVYGTVDDDDPFPDLRRKRVLQVHADGSGPVGRPQASTDDDDEALAVGEGTGGDLRGADVVPATTPLDIERQTPPWAMEFVRGVVRGFTTGRSTMRAPVGALDAMPIDLADDAPPVWLARVDHAMSGATTSTLVGVVLGGETPEHEDLWLLKCAPAQEFAAEKCEAIARFLRRSPTGVRENMVGDLQVALHMRGVQPGAPDRPAGLTFAVAASLTRLE